MIVNHCCYRSRHNALLAQLSNVKDCCKMGRQEKEKYPISILSVIIQQLLASAWMLPGLNTCSRGIECNESFWFLL